MSSEVDVIATATADEIDLELISRARKGSRSALDQFVRRNERWVRGIVYATSGNASAVDDVVQHVWTRVWQQIGSLADPARWRGWLYTLARNAAIDAGQKRTRQQSRVKGSLECTELPAPDMANPALRLVRDEESRRMMAAIQGLPAIYREPFILRHLEDWSYKQIGEALDLPVDTVETRLVRARRLLRQALADLV